jgi:4-hydroxybenzoate polyprenyltransferase
MTATATARPSLAARAVAYARLPHFVPIVIVLTTTALLALGIAGRTLDRSLLAAMLLAMLGGQIVVGVVNELVDLPTDRLTQPHKPIPSGLVGERGARLLAAGGGVLLLAAGAWLGPLELAVCALGNGVGVAYSLWFKRTVLAWLPYVIALPLIPVWVAICLDRFDPALLLLFPAGAAAIVGAQVAQALPDIDADRAAGIDSLTTRLGRRRAFATVWGAVLLTALIALVASAALLEDAGLLRSAAAVAMALTALDMALVRWRPRAGVMAAFPCAAGGIALLGVATVATLV